ncbi:hypothetical protein C7999DRAFT_16683 [Corynascus novoguineensis]|uniref:Centrosomin N-terminal motif 1 domain-containing protein n=1 Tax=Corynascus novoguineensis TaxID=1126955 RepID=A0AAN7CNN0_9PEZI|nr:hypothetical protein C7999DRAFT_16683 [Corynascus novoguineensis]
MDTPGAAPRAGSSLSRTHHTQPTQQPDSSPVYSISPLLLERLQRSRQIENDRVSSRSSTDMLSSSGSRHVRSPSPTSSHRPGSSGGAEPVKVKKGLGVKEMEQTLSTLHKQNFDLKLELYHRRERQTALEARIDALEREAKERDELNDSLVHELEKRDKAVEEAIGMILTLEKRVEQLLLERKMVLQVEAEEPEYSRVTSPVPTPNFRSAKFDSASPVDSRTPIRMPSFVSDRSENTENLRSVYLGSLACESGLTLSRLVEDTPDTARLDRRLASPALSELSESSFVSVYGRTRTVDLPSTPGNRSGPWDASSRTTALGVESPVRTETTTPSVHHRPSSSRVTSGQFHNIGGDMAVDPSPIQRTRELRPTHTSTADSPRPLPVNKEQSPLLRPPHAQPKTKREKREALERVITQAQFSSHQALPPTPDTLSTSTLPHNETPSKDQGSGSEQNRQSSAETSDSRVLGEYEQISPYGAAQPASTTAFDSRKHLNETDESSHASVAAPDSRAAHLATDSTNVRTRDGNSWGGDVSRHAARHRRDSTTSSIDTWLRESLKPESTEALGPMSSISQAHGHSTTGRISPDLFSFPTSADGWAANTMLGSHGGKGYVGTHDKSAYTTTPTAGMLGVNGDSIPTPNGRKTPIHGAAAPPPPNRRSSLLARTGNTTDAIPGMESMPQSPRPSRSTSSKMNSPTRGNRARSNSTDVRSMVRGLTELSLKQDRAMTVPPKQVHAPPPPNQQQQPGISAKHNSPAQPLPKQRHYPPPSQTSRPRSRGLNSLFRRSMGSADVPAPPASAPPTQAAFRPPPPHYPQQQKGSESGSATGMGMGMPSWVRRASLADDDRVSGATPPPILRKKDISHSSVGGAGVNAEISVRDGVGDDEDGDGGVVLEPSPPAHGTPGGGIPVGVAPAGKPSSRKSWGSSPGGAAEGGGEAGGVSLGGSGGGKRKWLGLGRVSSLRNRGGA